MCRQKALARLHLTNTDKNKKERNETTRQAEFNHDTRVSHQNFLGAKSKIKTLTNPPIKSTHNVNSSGEELCRCQEFSRTFWPFN